MKTNSTNTFANWMNAETQPIEVNFSGKHQFKVNIKNRPNGSSQPRSYTRIIRLQVSDPQSDSHPPTLTATEKN